MKYDHILVRFGEISTKGKNRKKFIEKLRQHIRFVLKDFEALKYASDRDRITIMLNGEDPEPISEQLKGVFGIQSFSLAVKCETNLDAIKEEQDSQRFRKCMNKEIHLRSQRNALINNLSLIQMK